jgi:hypothetical protein
MNLNSVYSAHVTVQSKSQFREVHLTVKLAIPMLVRIADTNDILG